MTPTTSKDGSIFVIIHGVGLSHRVYGRLARALSSRGAVIAVDLPGFGETRKPDGPVSVEEYAAITKALLDQLEVDSFVLVGHSMGAQMAVALALLDPDRARGVVMVGPVVDSKRRTLLQQSIALARDTSREPFATNVMVMRDYLACGMRWYLSEAEAMLSYDTRENVALLTVPLLIIRGDHDFIARESWCDVLARTALRGESVSIPGHRHVVTHSNPDATATLIADFAEAAVL